MPDPKEKQGYFLADGRPVASSVIGRPYWLPRRKRLDAKVLTDPVNEGKKRGNERAKAEYEQALEQLEAEINKARSRRGFFHTDRRKKKLLEQTSQEKEDARRRVEAMNLPQELLQILLDVINCAPDDYSFGALLETIIWVQEWRCDSAEKKEYKEARQEYEKKLRELREEFSKL
jgi:hypothetical protein